MVFALLVVPHAAPLSVLSPHTAYAAAVPSETALPSVGVEGRLETNLAGTLLVTRPVDPKAPLLLRIAGTRPHGSRIAYDFRYVGLEPGRHDLREYLARRDGSATDDLPPLPVEVGSLLPAAHDGILLPVEPSPWRRLGGYRVAVVMGLVLWVLLLVPLWLQRARPAVRAPEGPPPEPTLAERLRPLMARAAAGELDLEGKAQLERLVLAHWRERLALPDSDIATALTRLREHPEGGAILRALEQWLHRPPGSGPVDLEPLLAPYR